MFKGRLRNKKEFTFCIWEFCSALLQQSKYIGLLLREHYILHYSDLISLNFVPLDKDKTGTKVQKGFLLLTYISYIVLGAVIFGALERDFEVQQRCLGVKAKTDFLKNHSNMTREDVQSFVQVTDEEVGIFRVIILLSMQRSRLV